MKIYKMYQNYFAVFILLAVGGYLALQSSLMPFTRDGVISTDTGVWLQIAKEITEGRMAYRDLFDHKGPLLFLLYSVFFRIGGITGVWFLQCAFLAVVLAAGYQCARKISSNHIVCAYAVMCAMLGRSIFGGEDFPIEEVALPFIMVSLYIFVSYFCDPDRTIKKKEILLLGFCMGCVLCLRPNMIALWMVFVPAVFLELLYHRRYQELWSCAGCFLAGLLLILALVGGWLWYHGALQSCWEDSIRFNFLYVGQSDVQARIEVLGEFFFHPLQFVCVCFSILMLAVRKDDRILYGTNLLYMILNVILASMSGVNYHNYEIALLPGLVLPFAGGLDCLWGCLEQAEKRWRPAEPFWIMSLCLFVLFGSNGGVHGLRRIMNNINVSEEEGKNLELMEYVRQSTQKEDRIAVVGNSVYVYLGADRCSATEFLYTRPICDLSEELGERFMSQMEAAVPPLVVFEQRWFEEPPGYRDKMIKLLEEHYVSTMETDSFIVYERL